MTLDEANALLHRMAWGPNPWFSPQFCGVCGGDRPTHRTKSYFSDDPVPPCPVRPISDVAELRTRLRIVEWTGAGCCMACHAMLPEMPEGVEFNGRPYHKPNCAVARFLNDAGGAS